MITKIYLKKAAAAFCFLLMANYNMLAQTQNPVWSLPPFYDIMQPTLHTPQPNPMYSVTGAVVYGTSPPPYYVGAGYNTNYASNVIANVAGQPLVGKNWVEPLREWVKTSQHAGKMANLQMDLSEFKAFSETLNHLHKCSILTKGFKISQRLTIRLLLLLNSFCVLLLLSTTG